MAALERFNNRPAGVVADVVAEIAGRSSKARSEWVLWLGLASGLAGITRHSCPRCHVVAVIDIAVVTFFTWQLVRRRRSRPTK